MAVKEWMVAHWRHELWMSGGKNTEDEREKDWWIPRTMQDQEWNSATGLDSGWWRRAINTRNPLLFQQANVIQAIGMEL